MNGGKELIARAFRCEYVDRIPWVPFTGVHAARLIGKGAAEYLQSSPLIVEGISNAIELYRPDGVPVMFDLQVEAEALGCKLKWTDSGPPTVISHPLSGGLKIGDLRIPSAGSSRIPVVMKAASQLREKFPETALYGLVTGPFTLALHLMGTDIFMKMFEEPDEVRKLMDFCSGVAKMMSDAYIESGCDVIAIVDPMTSQIDPVSFDTFVSPWSAGIFRYIHEHGAFSSFFVCGNATQNIDAMCQCGPDNISIDENIPLEFVRDTAGSYNISFGGNMKLTVALLMGTTDDCRREALECMDKGGRKGFILAPGCDLPMETPPENIIAVTEIVHDELLQGKVRAMGVNAAEVEKLELGTHWHKDKVVIDVITLDSATCAPCQYMIDAVAKAARSFGEKVVYREYRTSTREGVQMMASLNVRNLPAIVIDGKVEFTGIPPQSTLEEKIREYLQFKDL